MINSMLDIVFWLSTNIYTWMDINDIYCTALELLDYFQKLSLILSFLSHWMLWCALVHPILEYCSVILDLHTSEDSIIMELVYRNFLRYVFYVFRMSLFLPMLIHLSISFSICLALQIVYHRLSVDLFHASLLTGFINSPSSIDKNCFMVFVWKTCKTASSFPYIILYPSHKFPSYLFYASS